MDITFDTSKASELTKDTSQKQQNELVSYYIGDTNYVNIRNIIIEIC